MSATTLATVAQAKVIGAFPTGYSLSDTAANLAAAPAAVANQAINIIATTVATVAQATVIDAFVSTGVNSYSLTDTGANLAAASASVGNGATNISQLGTVRLTVAQAI